MTQKEIELELFRLNAEYTRRSNEIGRRKQESIARKQEALLEADDAFHAERRGRLERIRSMRAEKAAMFDGDPRKAVIEAEARAIEAEISVMRDDNDRRKRRICHAAYEERCALDEESRQLTEWLQGEKEKVLEEAARELAVGSCSVES